MYIITEPDWNGRTSNVNGIVHIGENTVIREYTIINKPVESRTYVGDDCYIMNRCFIGHDTYLGNNVNLYPGCSVAGFVTIHDGVSIGMNSSIHQRSVIGPGCMIGAGSFFKGKSPGGITWGGVPAKPIKINTIGINKLNISDEEKESMYNVAKLFINNFKISQNI